jgi:multiple sugar transport system ATP-binding protein
LKIGDVTFATVPRPAGLADRAPVTVGVRPERVTLASEGADARVDLVEPTGLGMVVHLVVGGQELKLFTTDRPKIAVGETVRIKVQPADIRLFDRTSGVRLRLPQ